MRMHAQPILATYTTHIHTCIRNESGSDDPDNLGHFLEGQVGLIRKLNYLDVHDPDITCSFENSVGIWDISEILTLGLMNALKYH